MQAIEIELMNYCNASNLAECLEILRHKLKKPNQLSMYDRIYDNVMEQEKGKISYETVIPGLNEPIKLMIFTRLYQHLLFPSLPQVNVESEILQQLIDHMNDDYNSDHFVNTAYFICTFQRKNILFVDDYYNLWNRIMKNTDSCHFFYYVLIHKAVNLSFESLGDMLFGNQKYIKLPVGFKLQLDKNGPHGGNITSVGDFFSHDVTHVHCVISRVPYFRTDIIYTMYNRYTKGTFARRCIELFLIKAFFDNDNFPEGASSSDNIFDIYHCFSFEEIDHIDIPYFMKYLIESSDIGEIIHDELKAACTKYQKRVSALRILQILISSKVYRTDMCEDDVREMYFRLMDEKHDGELIYYSEQNRKVLNEIEDHNNRFIELILPFILQVDVTI